MKNHESLRKCKLKPQQIPLILNRIKTKKTVTIPNAGEDVEQLELSDIAERNAKMIQPLESLAVSREVERTLGTQPRDRTP